jgi:acetylornithine deacetylase/succinyl-diaminopimelate desuccinylase-like protein
VSHDCGETCLQRVRDDWSRSVSDLSELLAQPSVSAHGVGMEECARLVARRLERSGFATEVHETDGYPIVLGELGQGERTLLLYAHYDVQPAEPLELWSSPPFEPSVRDARLYARGAVDDKGHIVSRLAAIDAYVVTHGPLPFRVVFLVDGEEEIGSPSLYAFVERHAARLSADGCIWEHGAVDDAGRPVIRLGLRGYASVELGVRTATKDVHSGELGHLPNAAWRLVWALASLKGPDERIAIDGFYDDVVAPTDAQRELLAAAPAREDDERRRFGLRAFAGDRSGRALREAVFLPTCTVTGIASGYDGAGFKNILPATARAKLEFRLVPRQSPQRVVGLLRAHLDAHGFEDVELSPGDGPQHAAVADPEHPFVARVVEAAAAAYPEPAVVLPITGGSGPMDAFVTQLQTPVVIGVGVGYPGCAAHAPDEHLRIDDWIRGTQHMAAVLESLARDWAP